MKHWNYKGVADITIGEVQKSKVPSIILSCVIILISVAIILAIYFREYIRDAFVIPEIILSTNEVSVELGSEFDPKSYIVSKNENGAYNITGDKVDTSILNAEYTVIYEVWNLVNFNSTELKVKVVDDTAPTISLSSNNKKIKLDENNSFTLISGKSTDTMLGTKDFNVKKDISISVLDNHTPEEMLLDTLKITPEKPDFTLDKNEISKNVTISFEVTDEVGLVSEEHIMIIVVNGMAEIPSSSSSSSSTSSSTTSSTNSSSTTTSSSSTTTSSSTSSYIPPPISSTTTSSYTPSPESSSTTTSMYTPPPTPPPVSSTTTSTYTPPPAPSQPFIVGVHDVSVPVGTGLQTIVTELLDGVYGSGYVSMEYRYVNPTIPGQYTVTFTSDDGVTESCTVTVY